MDGWIERRIMEEFKLSNIRLINGECLEVMEGLIKEGVEVDAVITDLPYKVTSCKWDNLIPFEPMWNCINKLVKDDGAVVLFGTEPFSSALRQSNLKMYKYDWIWKKSKCSNFLSANYQPRKIHEIISVFSKSTASYSPKGNTMKYIPQMGEETKAITRTYKDNESRKAFSTKSSKEYELKHNNVGRKFPESIIYFPNEAKAIHPTQKPTALMEYLVNTYSNLGDLILDFTMGSGSTGVACRNLDRKFIGIELKKEYFNVAKERILN